MWTFPGIRSCRGLRSVLSHSKSSLRPVEHDTVSWYVCGVSSVKPLSFCCFLSLFLLNPICDSSLLCVTVLLESPSLHDVCGPLRESQRTVPQNYRLLVRYLHSFLLLVEQRKEDITNWFACLGCPHVFLLMHSRTPTPTSSRPFLSSKAVNVTAWTCVFFCFRIPSSTICLCQGWGV